MVSLQGCEMEEDVVYVCAKVGTSYYNKGQIGKLKKVHDNETIMVELAIGHFVDNSPLNNWLTMFEGM